MGDVIADDNEGFSVRAPFERARLVKYELIAFWGVTATSSGHIRYKSVQAIAIICQFQTLGHIRAVTVTIIAMCNDSNPQVGNFSEKPINHLIDSTTYLSKAGVH